MKEVYVVISYDSIIHMSVDIEKALIAFKESLSLYNIKLTNIMIEEYEANPHLREIFSRYKNFDSNLKELLFQDNIKDL